MSGRTAKKIAKKVSAELKSTRLKRLKKEKKLIEERIERTKREPLKTKISKEEEIKALKKEQTRQRQKEAIFDRERGRRSMDDPGYDKYHGGRRTYEEPQDDRFEDLVGIFKSRRKK